MRILGIEFGAYSLKAVEMESRFRRMEILDLHEVRMPLQNTDPTTTYRTAVTELIGRLPHNPEKVVTSLPAAHTALRFLNIPLKQRKKVEQSFKFELEDNVPFKLEDSIIEHHVHPGKDGSLVFAAIAPKRNIQSHLDWLKSIGLDPDWLTFEGMGIINLYLSSIAEKKDEKPLGPVLLLDIGHLKTNVSIVNHNRLEFFRSIAWGGMQITQNIALGLSIPIEEAEQRKIRDLRLDELTGGPSEEAEELLASAGQAFSPFLADISHSLVAYRSIYKEEVSSIILTGGTAKLPGIDEFLTNSLQIPVSFFKPFSHVNLGKEIDVSQEMRFGEPLGRAIVFTRKSELLFNFRREDLAKGTSLTEVTTFLQNPNVIRLMRYTAVLVAMLFVHVMISGYAAESEARKASDELKKVFGETFRTGVNAKTRTLLTSDPRELKKFLDGKNNELNQKLKMLSKERTPVMSLIRAISDAFPKEVEVDVNSLALDDRQIKVEGVLYKGDLEKVTENLKTIKAFSNIKLEKDGQRFTFKGDVVGR